MRKGRFIPCIVFFDPEAECVDGSQKFITCILFLSTFTISNNIFLAIDALKSMAEPPDILFGTSFWAWRLKSFIKRKNQELSFRINWRFQVRPHIVYIEVKCQLPWTQKRRPLSLQKLFESFKMSTRMIAMATKSLYCGLRLIQDNPNPQ